VILRLLQAFPEVPEGLPERTAKIRQARGSKHQQGDLEDGQELSRPDKRSTMRKSRPPYPREFREEGVRLSRTSGRPMALSALPSRLRVPGEPATAVPGTLRMVARLRSVGLLQPGLRSARPCPSDVLSVPGDDLCLLHPRGGHVQGIRAPQEQCRSLFHGAGQQPRPDR